MHVTLRHLRAAVAVAEQASFRRAAELLHVSQPALSQTMSELERTLGAVLFDRTSRSVQPTALGRSFVERAQQVLEDVDRLLAETGDIAEARRGRVVVACVSSVAGRVIPWSIQRCAKHHPGVDVRIADDVASQVLASVDAGRADFAVTIAPSELPEHLRFEALAEDPFYVVCDRDHPFAHREDVRWADLSNERLVELSSSSGVHRLLRTQLQQSGVTVRRSTTVSHLSTVHGLLEAGFGIGILPRIALPVPDHPTLVSKLLTEPARHRVLGICRRADRSLTPAANVFLEVVRGVLGDMAAGVVHQRRRDTRPHSASSTIAPTTEAIQPAGSPTMYQPMA